MQSLRLAQSDVILLCDIFQTRLRANYKLQHMRAYHLFATHYNMQDQFCVFAWEVYREWSLADQAHVLALLLQTIDGNGFFFVEQEVQKKKRILSEISSEDGPGKTQRKAFWVGQKEVQGAALLTRARQECKNITGSTDPQELSQVLAEIDQFTLAVEMALSNDVCPAYAIALQLHRKKDTDRAIGYIERLKAQECVSLARNLAALEIQIPSELVQKMISLGLFT